MYKKHKKEGRGLLYLGYKVTQTGNRPVSRKIQAGKDLIHGPRQWIPKIYSELHYM